MKATDVLKNEHKLVLAVLGAAEEDAARMRDTGEVDLDRMRQLLEFFRVFVDRCHHAKEEHRLFPWLEDRGFPVEGGPIAVMLAEHDEGRGYVQAIESGIKGAEDGEPEAVAVLADALTSYADLLRAHIAKENNILFPMADARLSDQDQEDLITEFDEIEAEEVGVGVHERCHRLAEGLLKKDE
jgi:hemerythrin-like domain-containing protein